MEKFMEIGNPNIPSPNCLPNNNINILLMIATGIGLMAIIIINHQLLAKMKRL